MSFGSNERKCPIVVRTTLLARGPYFSLSRWLSRKQRLVLVRRHASRADVSFRFYCRARMCWTLAGSAIALCIPGVLFAAVIFGCEARQAWQCNHEATCMCAQCLPREDGKSPRGRCRCQREAEYLSVMWSLIVLSTRRRTNPVAAGMELQMGRYEDCMDG